MTNDPTATERASSAGTYFGSIREHPEASERDIRLISRERTGEGRILEIGCGAGGFLRLCGDALGNTLGIDRDPESARLCRGARLPMLLADGGALPFHDGSMQVVRAKMVLEHILELPPFMLEIHRVLEPGGLLLIQIPTQYSLLYPVNNFYDDYTHIRPLTRPGLRRLFTDTGFETLFVRGYTAGRNAVERLLGRALARFFPHSWVAMARKTSAGG